MSLWIQVGVAHGNEHSYHNVILYIMVVLIFYGYINYQLHTGVAVGPEFCGPESPAIRDPNLWVVTIGECCIKTC